MKTLFIFIFIFIFSSNYGFSQTTGAVSQNKVVVFKDYRLNILQRKEAEINAGILKTKAHTADGYRLMILNTSDKAYAFKIRAQLLQKFPDQKLYMWYANPYIRMKFGNFQTKEEADVYKKQISEMLGGANIYYVPETIEVAPDMDLGQKGIKL
jgi:hypothetical protein